MERIAIDMDDVIASAELRFADYAKERLGKNIEDFDLHGKTWPVAAGVDHDIVRSWVFEKGFFRGMKVIENSQEVVKKLSEKYEIFIVSAAMEFPNSLKEKLEWMEEHFPFITWKYIVFCGHKYMFKADYLIDDHAKNLEPFTGKPLLFTAHHNAGENRFTRMNNWREIEKLLL